MWIITSFSILAGVNWGENCVKLLQRCHKSRSGTTINQYVDQQKSSNKQLETGTTGEGKKVSIVILNMWSAKVSVKNGIDSIESGNRELFVPSYI